MELPQGAKPFHRQLARGVGVDVFVESLEPNALGPHNHTRWQLLVISPGSAMEVTWRLRGEKAQARRIVGGEVWILPPGWTQTARWREPSTAFFLYIDAANVHRFYPQLRHTWSINPLTEYVAAIPAIADVCRELFQFAEAPMGLTDWRVAATGSHLAVLFIEAHLALSDGVFRPPSPLVGRLLEKLNVHLTERTNERLPLAKIARNLGVSDRHLRRIFRESVGASPQEWVMVHKAKKAAHLLLDGVSVKETVEKAGFTSESHLHRVIFRTYGVSPAAFRKRALAAAVPARA